MQTRFHLQYKSKRTTISVDKILSVMMAIKLGFEPESKEAYAAVRAWLQDKIVSSLGDDDHRKSASYWARIYLIEEIADKKLSAKWSDWFVAQHSE